MGSRAFRANLSAYLFLAPWLIGLFLFMIGPMLASLYLSFTQYDLVTAPRWIGLQNFSGMFADERFYQAVRATALFVGVAVPLKLSAALGVALLLNRNLRFIGLYRTVYYVPSLIGGSVAVAVMWRQIFGGDGLFNRFLSLFGADGMTIWIASPTYAIYTICLLAVWQFGSSMVIFLAGLKQIPEYLYESSAIDGAGKLRQFISITLPMLSPVLFFNLVMQTIGAFLMFTQAFIVTKGGPMDSTLVYALFLYEQGFSFLKMGYASALSWVLLAAIGLCTLLFFATSRYWVYYETGGDRA
ncbi:carbohydrate ABC transporter membrane protein 1, CUT1 family [Paenibacillus sp. UNCCL117]|uniref:carbohydrate ABC transporter permease n=1 Tax=unclassified Paenibacillus TaxID=185978 RepID=UPI00088B5141|nr:MULTISPECIES: sugar ABC transporter permease [unclassified Paenibacillus]SDC28332.1 carbohydrate ABC transporter membrane protein 1, CUT1 family [Paenibacillus sp. cl123]SFW20532.1 carbohydrate ABC transporter membrane protein 1, CUT1 family [Paenibacillus sp. UNCCL117]